MTLSTRVEQALGAPQGGKSQYGSALGVRTETATRAGRKVEEYAPLIRNGVKYERFGTRRGPTAGIFDRDVIQNNLEKHRQGYGRGRTYLAYVDDEGKIIQNSVMEHNGRLYESKQSGPQAGLFNIVDGDAMKYRKELREEAETDLNRLLELCVEDPENLADALNINVNELDQICSGAWYKDMPSFIAEANCHPDYMSCLPASSKEYALGIAKLKFILRKNTVIIENSTKTKSIVEANDDK